jgi:hypothetical protein
MKIQERWVLGFPLVLALAFGPIALNAQDSSTKAKTGEAVTVTGCLQKGDEAGEYSLTGENGKKYGLHSKTDLSKHLGHKVTVTGTKMLDEDEEKHEAGKKTEYADLRVTNIKHISESCQ